MRTVSPHYSRGMTLLEVMFAVFVLSVGLIGIAGLQLVSKHSSFEAIQRTTATLLANDIAERMRANTGALASYLNTSELVVDGTEPSPACTSGASCTATQLAAHDLWEWHQAILGATDTTSAGAHTGGLVSPSACITANGTGYTIAIAWRGQTELSNPSGNTCGSGATGNPYGDSNQFRRVLAINAFIAD